MKKLFNRLKEPSSWAALAALSILFGVPPETAHAVVAGLGVVVDAAGALGLTPGDVQAAVVAVPTVVAGAAAFLLPEKARE